MPARTSTIMPSALWNHLSDITMAADPALSQSSTSRTERSGSAAPTRRSTACTGCRTVKAKCETDEDERDCTRCRRRGEVCERPVPQRGGRPKGSKNQQTALERALQVIEREVHRNKRPRLSVEQDARSPRRDSPLGSPTIHSVPHGPQSGSNRLSSERPSQFRQNRPPSVGIDEGYQHQPPLTSMLAQSASYSFAPLASADPPNLMISPHSLGSHPSQPTVEEEHDQDNGLSNPVRLLAEAAEESNSESWDQTIVHRPPVEQPSLPPQYTLPDTLAALLNDGQVDKRVADLSLDNDYLAQGLESLLSDTAHKALTDEDKRFFKPARNQVKRDLGADYDPLDLALITMKEAKVFFASFFAKLHPVLPVLDPALHTPDFVRSRSAFLLTAICAHGASLTVGAEEATKRLRIHAHRLSELISRRGFASVEIVQAFLVWISWLPSSQPFQEEKLWHETKYAINMAVELEIARPLGQHTAEGGVHASFASCLESIPPNDQPTIDRIMRNRQRLWLHLFLWDSSLSLAFGKATRFSQDYLTRDESWCFHPLATAFDRVTTACVVLRRRMVGLSDTLRSEILMRAGSTSEWVIGKVDEVLDPWHNFWTQQCDNSSYLELVYRHSRLWSLSYALQTLSFRGGLVQALTDDCFASALSTCEFACEQLRQSRALWGFPNTMGPMLSFEVLLAVRLFPISPLPQTGPAARARVLGLLAQLSLLLERVGTTPPHRLGTAAVYGRHLQVYLRKRLVGLCIEHERKEGSRYGYATDQLGGMGTDVPLILGGGIGGMNGVTNGNGSGTAGFAGAGMPSAEMTIDQLFASSQVSPTDQAQAGMALNWNGWTEDFFRIFGAEQ